MNKSQLTSFIRQRSEELNFDLCGIARSGKLSDRAGVLTKWCEAGMHDKMGYLARNIDKRFDPELLFPDVKSLVVTGISYYSPLKQKDPHAPLLSRYAYGRNYHEVITEKLEKLLSFIKSADPGIEGMIFADSGTVTEKGWAQQAGLGWQGRHSIIINDKIGSFFFIGILMLNTELEFDEPYKKDLCKGCRLCIESCPTGAINENRTIDSRKCIANLVIENRGPIPEDIIPKLGGRVYGCDKCQEACPWNKKIKPNNHPEFEINPQIAGMTKADWKNLTEDQYNTLFAETALERVKFTDLKRNIEAAIRSMDN